MMRKKKDNNDHMLEPTHIQAWLSLDNQWYFYHFDYDDEYVMSFLMIRSPLQMESPMTQKMCCKGFAFSWKAR